LHHAAPSSQTSPISIFNRFLRDFPRSVGAKVAAPSKRSRNRAAAADAAS
jgi:hypothetical protein